MNASAGQHNAPQSQATRVEVSEGTRTRYPRRRAERYAALSAASAPLIAACAAASRAIGTRGAEHDT